MKDTMKKVINIRFDRYQDIENKLEKLAAKGWLLDACGTFLWTFRKGEPKKLKYTVTYFSEGSLFNPGITDNQQTYFDYAKAAGWNFVAQLNQMQIFCSEADNLIPFETDEKEKLENIKKCMKKSFLRTIVLLIIVFAINLAVQFQSFLLDPVDFLSDSNRLLSVFMILAVVLYEVYSLCSYFSWCKRSERSIAGGGGCILNNSIVYRSVDVIFLCFIFSCFGYFVFLLFFEINGLGIFLTLVQIPILMLVFWSSIKYLKKRKASALINKVISITVLIIADFVYLAFFMMLMFKFGFHMGNDSTYRTVLCPAGVSAGQEYRLYSDDIPLTCQDIYSPIDYDYYSYEKDINSTIFLTKSNYRQNPLPAEEAPPRIEYDILEPRFDFVYRLAKKHLLEIPYWRENMNFKSIENEIFGTNEAYQLYFEDTPAGAYILFFQDKIIVLDMEEPLTEKQILLINEKL